MQAFTRFFVDRWQFTLVLFVMLFGLGIQSVMSIPKSEDPIVSFPGVGVFVVPPPRAIANQLIRVCTGGAHSFTAKYWYVLSLIFF